MKYLSSRPQRSYFSLLRQSQSEGPLSLAFSSWTWLSHWIAKCANILERREGGGAWFSGYVVKHRWMEKMCSGMRREICGELSALLTEEPSERRFQHMFYRPAAVQSCIQGHEGLNYTATLPFPFANHKAIHGSSKSANQCDRLLPPLRFQVFKSFPYVIMWWITRLLADV